MRVVPAKEFLCSFPNNYTEGLRVQIIIVTWSVVQDGTFWPGATLCPHMDTPPSI